jgi:hypothetical protein
MPYTLYAVMAFSSPKFIRRTDDLLKLFNIAISDNKNRAILRLEKYLNELERKGFISWEKDTAYHIHRLLDPKNGKGFHNDKNELGNAESKHQGNLNQEYSQKEKENSNQIVETETLKKSKFFSSDVYKDDDLEWHEQMTVIFEKLRGKINRSQEDEIRVEIIQSVEKLNKNMPNIKNEQMHYEIKQAIVRKQWDLLSPYYLWSNEEFHKYIEVLCNSGNKNPSIQKAYNYFEKIRKNSSLQKMILEWVKAVEEVYGIPPNSPPQRKL